MKLLPTILLVALCGQVSPQVLPNGATEPPPPFQIDGCMENDQCVCRMSSNWSALSDYNELQRVKRELTTLKLTIGSLNVQRIYLRMENITQKMTTLESSIDQQSISVTMRELTALKKSVEILVNMVEQLRESGQTDEQLEALMEQLEALSTTVDQLWAKNPYGQNSEINKQLDDLRRRLAECHDKVDWTAFIGDNLPLNEKYDDWCDTHEVQAIGDSYTHRWVPQEHGAWFKDPVPLSEANRTQIFYRQYGGNIWTYRYANYTDFIGGRNHANAALFNAYGVGYVVYNQSIYWSYSNTIYRYDIQHGTRQTQVITKSNINYNGVNLNSWVDFKVDEYGLWMIVARADNANKLVVSKVDPVTLKLGPSYLTNKAKVSICASFMICGKLYTIDSCTSRLPLGMHQKQYVYDTRATAGAAKESYMALHVTSKYGRIYSLNYNPRERVIFGWDNRHLVTYPISWKTKATA